MKTKTNTARSFSDKWHKNTDLVFAETLREGSDIFNWIVTRNGWENADGVRAFLKDKKRVLDAGCGNGRVTALLRIYSNPESTQIGGVDLTASDVAAFNLKDAPNV
jgi:SAM-dependent methyltransferase